MATRRSNRDTEETTEANDNSTEERNTHAHERKREINLLKHTETIDKLVIQNKHLTKDLEDADREIDALNERLQDSSIRISKNLFYVGLIVIGYLVYAANAHLTAVNNSLIEMNIIVKEYQEALEKTELYNRIMLERDLGVDPDK